LFLKIKENHELFGGICSLTISTDARIRGEYSVVAYSNRTAQELQASQGNIKSVSSGIQLRNPSPTTKLLVITGALIFAKAYAFQVPPAAAETGASKADYSKESFVIDTLSDDVIFFADGTGQQERAARIRIQSDAAIQQLGVLTFPYKKAFEKLDILEVRVIKPNGIAIVTPESEAQDLPTAIARSAPTYSDSREKQVPVKGLGVGDVLEWRIRTVRTSAQAPGQFWFAHTFVSQGVVLQQTLNITVPAGKYVKVSSPKYHADVREQGGKVTYSWKTAQLAPSQEQPEKDRPHLPKRASVELTTFRNWEEVGRWYSDLQKSRAVVTPAIEAKASELTRGLTTNADKQRAIYRFVSTTFRYISVSFGEGRYQPHSADEVLANQFGDCKDKHTLFAALLKAAGIESWPALIGAGIELDLETPSPAQFNHVITYIPDKESALWLDTTPEVAPFGVLQSILRDKKALVIPENGAASLMTTPDVLPFRADETVDVKSKLSADGILTAHFDITLRGDNEILFRNVFHGAAPAQWPQLAQQMSRAIGFVGIVSGVVVDNRLNTDTPFHYSYSYERKNYPEWENHRILSPLPPIGVERVAEMEPPEEPLFLGGLGKLIYRCTVQLPEGYSVTLPIETKVETDFADFRSSYAVDQTVLSIERIFIRKNSKVPLAQWEDYRKLAKAVSTDEARFIQLARSGARTTVTRDSPEAAALLQRAIQAIQNQEFNVAKDALAEAERLNPQQSFLWASYGFLYGMQRQNDKAIKALQKEIEGHPNNLGVYPMLASTQRDLGRNDDAMQTLHLWVQAAPGDLDATLALADGLIAIKRYDEAAAPLETALQTNPDDFRLLRRLLESDLRGGKKAEGSAILATLKTQKLDAGNQNEVAYVLADTNTELTIAIELAQKSVTAQEEQTKQSTLSAVMLDDLRRVNSLGAVWDTLGWAYFRSGDLARSEKFLQASWVLLQEAASADHLGQLYERQGKKPEAIHAYRLALGARPKMLETKERLEMLGGTVEELVTVKPGRPPSIVRAKSAVDELSEMRTIPVPTLSQHEGSAEFLLLFSSKGVLESRFANGDEKLKGAESALSKISYKLAFPDDGPERIIRRGILSCSQYTTPACNLVLLLPANTQP
jgi:tetratricopeptide (TPR) repeat protein